MKIDAILLMAGTSSRFEAVVHKTFYQINQKPLFLYALEACIQSQVITEIYLVVHEDDWETVETMLLQNPVSKPVHLIPGGNTRARSVRNALNHVVADAVIIHDCARPLLQEEDITTLVTACGTSTCGTFYHDVIDTIKQVTSKVQTIDRKQLKAVTTPQYFSKQAFPYLLNPTKSDDQITDELSLMENVAAASIAFVKELHANPKLTTKADTEYIQYQLMKCGAYRIGHSFDFHPFTTGKPLLLGGVTLPTDFGLEGHSDADVVYHVVAESLMGAIGMGDLGTLFPDTDMKYHQMDSSLFVKEVMCQVTKQHYQVINMDIIIYLERPSLKQAKPLMAEHIRQLTNCQYVNVKATTLEKKGLIGQGYGIAAEAVVLIKRK